MLFYSLVVTDNQECTIHCWEGRALARFCVCMSVCVVPTWNWN